jgi:2-polyprenyl-3-methyl-5-hydroxy-6-metoxy-1,4-benzoquinol methylase
MGSTVINTKATLDCPLCGGNGFPLLEGLSDRLYGVPGYWNFLNCSRCHVLWLNPRPVAKDIPKCYPSEYFTHQVASEIRLGSSPFKRRLRLSLLRNEMGYSRLEAQSRTLSILSRFIWLTSFLRAKATLGMEIMLLPFCPDGRLLDVGCGNGVYLAFMKELGWEVAGVEMDAEAAQVARSIFGITVHAGSLEDAPYQKASFDAITMNHVIEHVPDPISFVCTAASFLKPAGRMVIVTPNIQSFGSRLFKKGWFYLDPPRHMVIFNPQSLKMCLEKTNMLRQIKVTTLSRKSQKMARKFALLQKTGLFFNENEPVFARAWEVKIGSLLFELLERLGNPLFQWGEEIGCIAVKV